MKELIQEIKLAWPGLYEELCDPVGDLKSYVNIYVNAEDIRFARGIETALNDDDVVSIVAAVAGG